MGETPAHETLEPSDLPAGAATPPPPPASPIGGLGGAAAAQVAVVPPWLMNLAALGWRLVAIAGLVTALWFVAATLWTVTASIAVAVVVAALFAPAVLRLRLAGRSRTAAAAIVWAAAILGIGALLVGLVLAFLPYLGDLLRAIQTGLELLEAELAALGLPPVVVDLARRAVGLLRDLGGSSTGGLIAAAAGVVTVLILATFLVFFFLRDGDRAWGWVFQDVSESKRHRITEAGTDALNRVGGYLRGTTVLSAIIAGTDLVFMLILGLPLAVPLTILVFLTGYIPYFGGIVATALILLVALASQGITSVLILVGLIAVRNVILGYGVRPALYGRSVSIHPALVLIALPAGLQLAGIVGLFAAVPVTAVLFAVARAAVMILEPDPPPQLPGLVPAWIDRVAQWSWRLLVVAAFGALLVALFVAIPLVLLPIVVAVILAATLEPVVDALERRRWSRAKASAVTVGGGLLAVIAVLVFSVVSLVAQAGPLLDRVLDGAGSADDALGGNLGLFLEAVRLGLNGTVEAIVAVAGAVVSVVTIVVLGALLSFYMLRDGAGLWSRVVARARPDATDDLRRVGRQAIDVLGGYMGGTAAISFVGAASQFVIMVVLGIDLALPVFVLSFFLGFIPYIGGFISTGIAFLLTVAVGSTTDIVVMAVWTLVFNIVTGNIVGPIVYGRTVHIHPAVVLLAIPAGSAIAGILGMFLVVPAIGIVAATWRTVLAVMGARAAERAAVAASPPPAPAAPPPVDPDEPLAAPSPAPVPS